MDILRAFHFKANSYQFALKAMSTTMPALSHTNVKI